MRRGPKTQDATLRFESKIRITPGCWYWTGSRLRKGYGQFKANRKMVKAHRYSYELYVTKIPEGQCVLHRCDNPTCVNPDHLFLGTQLDNIIDRVIKRRSHRCLGTESHFAKLTEEQVRSIHVDKRSQYVIAKSYGVSQANISLIKRGKNWPHLFTEAV